MSKENLAHWKPMWKTVYAGYRVGNKRDEPSMQGRVIIHIGNEEHIGGFYIYGNGSVKVWSADGSFPESFTSFKQCKFTKSHEGNLNIYDVFVQNYDNNRNGANMTNDNSKTLPNYTPPREKSAGFWARVFKTRDPGYWKETLQKELDIRWGTFDSNLENLSKEWKGFKKTQMEITEAYDNAQSCEKGWSEALTSLGNLINKKTSHEKGMWAVTQSSRQSRNMKIKQKFIRAGVDEMNFNNMMDYIKQYPELQSSDIIEKAVSAVNDKRKEVSEAEKTYNQKMREANTYLNTAQSELRKIKKELDSFETFKDEGKAKIMAEQNKLTFKLKSTLMTAAEKEGLKLFIFEYDRKIGESRDQLKLMEDDLDNYQERKFVPIVTQKFKAVED